MKRIRPFLVFLLTYAVSVGFIPEFRAAATCPTEVLPSDHSTVTTEGNQDNCGETDWELKAEYGGFEWDEGDYDGAGTCTGGYLNCNCGNVAEGFKAPTKTFSSYLLDNSEAQWWWNIKIYNERVLNPCTIGNCQETGYKSETDSTFTEPNVGWDDESCLP